jgi:nucleoid-associated protein YgaU
MSVDYTLFKPSGEPLRAKVKLSFSGFMSKEEEALRANRSSPDLTHLIEVKAGDTLPMLCYRVYKDCSYYLEVAKVNGITNFRDLQLGTKLHFPPLR